MNERYRFLTDQARS